MIDFHLNIEAETQLWHVVFFLFFYLLCFFTNKKYIEYKDIPVRRSSRTILTISLIILTIAAYTRGDFFHYADIVQNYKYTGVTHMEAIYEFLIIAFNGNYLLWRIVVWGSALFLLFITFQRLKLDKHISFLFLFLAYITILNYSRTALAVAVYFFGLSFIVCPGKRKVLSYIIGILIVSATLLFHDSALALVLCTFFVFLPFNKITIPIILLVSFLMMGIGYDALVNYMDAHVYSEEAARQFISYLESEIEFTNGLASVIGQMLRYGSFYLPFILLSKVIFFSSVRVDSVVTRLYGVTFGLILIATVLAFTSVTNIFFYRLLYMSFVPIVILVSYCYKSGVLSQKGLKFCVYFGVLSVVYDSLYSLYILLL